MTVLAPSEQLPYLSSEQRLRAYQIIVDGCSHIWSKNKIQREKAQRALEALLPLTVSDPYFLAHLTSYAIKNTKNKDLQVFTSYVSALSSADGSPFSPGSSYKKPNLRYVAAAAVHDLDPKLAARVLELASTKYGVANLLNNARHFPTGLRTALEKYLKFIEANLPRLKGVKRAGLGNTLKTLYRGLHLSPSDEAAAILRWQQKDKKITFVDSAYKDFDKLTDLEIAERIRKDKLSVLGVLGALPRQVSPVIAVALLEQATGNQAVILRRTFEEAGVLSDPEVMKLYEDRIKTAKTALDRAETISADASQAVKEALTAARSEQRKAETAGIGKIFLHLDVSGSMSHVLRFAMERGAIFAECVNDPANNFAWGTFHTQGDRLPLPDQFVKDAFAAVLFGRISGGGTDCYALYPEARMFGADVDVFVTDQDQVAGPIAPRIARFHESHPDLPKPKACVIVNYGGRHHTAVKDAYEANGIPVALLDPDTLTQSALVSEAVKNALLGPVAIIDDIMGTELLELPDYYFTI